ncbi:hypothetical protein Aduo_005625 [Ancylostoma duodenale]
MMVAPSIYKAIEPMDTPPRTHLKVVEVQVEAGKPLDLVLSTNLVIRTVSKYSIAFHSVLVGDQILEINDIAPMGIPEFLSVMHAEQSMVESNSRGAHAFLKGDRLLDVDSIPVTNMCIFNDTHDTQVLISSLRVLYAKHRKRIATVTRK